jgi:hypothetical protein
MIRQLLYLILFGKEGTNMVAMLWVTRIVAGKKTFKDVPRLLKEQVRELLIEAGLEEFIIEED